MFITVKEAYRITLGGIMKFLLTVGVLGTLFCGVCNLTGWNEAVADQLLAPIADEQVETITNAFTEGQAERQKLYDLVLDEDYGSRAHREAHPELYLEQDALDAARSGSIELTAEQRRSIEDAIAVLQSMDK